MTIKDMESRTGMTRANIRFYESEGLLLPKRKGNGYREYTEEDFQILMKVKLLRMLHISLEEIKAIHREEKELEVALEENIKRLERQESEILKSQNVCTLMKNDHVKYENLNAEYYLESLYTMGNQSERISYDSQKDVMPKIKAQFRRFLARYLDLILYSNVFNIVVSKILGISMLHIPNIITSICPLIIMLLIEPVFLSKFGTTIGKKVLGIHITDSEGRKLPYDEALFRTWMVLWKGMGFTIPIYELVKLWKSYFSVEDNKELEWEVYSVLNLKDKKIWRVFAYVGVIISIFGLVFISELTSSMPKNRGNITVAEFAENYNQLAKYHDIDLEKKLDAEGKWYDSNENNTNVVIFSIAYNPRNFTYQEENGIMTGMRFDGNCTDYGYVMGNFKNEMMLAVLSFVQAQESCGLFENDIDELLEKIEASAFQDFEMEVHGVRITCEVDYEKYNEMDDSDDLTYTDEEIDNDFYILFTMEKL